MNWYLLDTNHASVAMDERSSVRQRLMSAADSHFHIPMPVLGELWFMVLNSDRVTENQARLEQLIRLFAVLPFDRAAAKMFGHIRVELRRAGRPIPQIDNQIAAIARSRGLIVLTADSHFGYVQNLRTENWLSP